MAGTFIPNILMKRINRNSTRYEPGIDDPRLPVIAMPTQYSNYSANPAVRFVDYRGVSMNADAQKPVYNGGERYYTGGPLGDILRNLKENSRSMCNFCHLFA
jgi:hypothetical protein